MKFWKFKKQRGNVKAFQKRKPSKSFVRNDEIRKRRNENFKRKVSGYSPLIKKLRVFVVPIMCVVLVIVFMNMLSKSELFKVRSYSIITDTPENQDDLVSYAKSFFETNNYFTSEVALKDFLNESIGNVQEVYIRKSLNDGLKIEVIFKVPEFYLVNFSGTYILSPQGEIVDIFSEGEDIPYNDLEKKYLDGKLTAESEEIRAIFLSRIEDAEERGRVIWKDVDVEKKNEILQETKDSIAVKKTKYIESQFDKVRNSKYSYLTGFKDYKEQSYKLKDFFDTNRLLFMQQISKEFQKRSLDMFELEWISEFSLKLKTSGFSGGTKEIVLSEKRPLSAQLKDIDTLIFYNTAESYRVIDLRSENYVLIR